MVSEAKIDSLNIEEQIANVHTEVFQQSMIVDVIITLCSLLVIVFLLIGTYKVHKKTPSSFTLTMLISVRLVLLFYVISTLVSFVLFKQIGSIYTWYLYEFVEVGLAICWLIWAFSFFKYSMIDIKEGAQSD